MSVNKLPFELILEIGSWCGASDCSAIRRSSQIWRRAMTEMYNFKIVEVDLGLGMVQRELCRFAKCEDAIVTLCVMFDAFKEHISNKLPDGSTVTKGNLMHSCWKTILFKVPPIRMERWYSLLPVPASDDCLCDPLTAETIFQMLRNPEAAPP
eukprot:TRINITY_DN5475_c0_g1_i1.p1 TRINITY_DN5475_c0_g1~~TRINITY_DN5475_c0_g1_i1.p1  ORF type:complete len:153 (+),score=28.23 TRINITY_DN5475_c0_g1_i1:191-649(+)